MLSTSFIFDAGSLRLDLGDVEIEAGRGAHRLRLPFSYRSSDMRHDMTGCVVQVSGSVRDGDGWLWLGDLSPVSLYVYSGDGAHSHLGLSLSDQQVMTLDASRRPDVDLHLDLVAVLMGQNLPPAVATVQYRTPGRHWVELTERLGTNVGMYVRVPVPSPGSGVGAEHDDTPSLTRAVNRLREAKSMAANQEWERCVGGCLNRPGLLGGS